MLAEVFTAKPVKTFGRLAHLSGKPAARKSYTAAWEINAEPHVMMEMKRLFKGYRQHPDGGMTIADTPESSYRVAWALLMFPLEMTKGTRERLEARTVERQDTRKAVEKILQGGQMAMRDGAYEPAIKLYPHQREAATLANTTGRLLLLDETGAMKTGSESIPQKEVSKARFVGGEGLQELQAHAMERHNAGEEAVFPDESRILIVSLRSGAGLDGLQHVAHTLVHGELDWSPAPHEQGDGRLDRPGQTSTVLSYRPHCDYGTDPIMLQKLAEKRQQGEGITDPGKAIFEPSTADSNRVREVAAAFLKRAGHHSAEVEPRQEVLV